MPEATPPPGEWPLSSPAEVGLDPEAVREAVAIASDPAGEVPFPKRDVPANHARLMRKVPHGEIVGPLRPRGGPNGVIVRDGHLVASWGEVEHADTTFSVSKSFISCVAGVAFDRGLIGSVDDPVGVLVDDGTFAGDHNSRITWEHLLQNRSEWEGTLWGKPDVADRREGVDRELRSPGTFWEYNDVRVNLCAYALLCVLGRPLPEVLDEAVMGPIGASASWEWHGYDTSWVEIGGRRVQSVAGGGHWGGGVIISALDMARFGLLYLNRGRWGQERLLSEEWMEGSVASCPIRADYGRFWWLNRLDDTKLWPPVPEEAFAARGYGGNTILVDPRHRLVAVTRWITDEAHLAFLETLMRACGFTLEDTEPTSDPASSMDWR